MRKQTITSYEFDTSADIDITPIDHAGGFEVKVTFLDDPGHTETVTFFLSKTCTRKLVDFFNP